ncbi:hypothetical protein AB9E29_31320 [Rhizobium leguminosarum]|uniref:hypothetical protein n=1 Tax=Rhizobium leguminosarum TaxID=384 RepID=UPI003F9CB239
MSRLSRDFEKYRRARRRELIKLGIPRSDAHEAAKSEALGRQAMVPVLGKEAALTSKILTKLRMDGTFAQFLVVPEHEVPPDLRDRAEAWAGAPDRPKAGSPAG